MKKLKGYKTLLFAIIGGVLSTLEAFEWTNILPDQYEAMAIPVIFGIFTYLRSITNTAIGQSIPGGGIPNPNDGGKDSIPGGGIPNPNGGRGKK